MKNNQINWLQKLMIGRNGPDQLCMGLLFLAFLISLIAGFVNQPIISYLSYIPFLLSIFRMFSKDVNKRRMENYKFMILLSPLYSWFTKNINKIKSRIKNRKIYKYFKCPNCKQKLRLPKGKGKLNVVCSKCKTKFLKKT